MAVKWTDPDFRREILGLSQQRNQITFPEMEVYAVFTGVSGHPCARIKDEKNPAPDY
jgi:hypothetical protein